MSGVSLVVPTYNRAALLKLTLHSALAQTRPFESIIVVDDGSTDDTAEMVREFGASVQYERRANGGVTGARAAGAALVESSHIAFLDSDDLLDPTFVAAHLHAHEQFPDIAFSLCNFGFFTHDTRATGSKHDDFPDAVWPSKSDVSSDGFKCNAPLYPLLIERQPIFVGSFVARTRAYRESGGYDPAFSTWGSEDFEFALRLAQMTPSYVIRTPLMWYRRHGAQATASGYRWMNADVDILRYSRAHHDLGARYAAAIDHQIIERQADLFDLAFTDRNWPAVKRHWQNMAPHARNTRRQLKHVVQALPDGVRRLAVHFLQRGRKDKGSGT